MKKALADRNRDCSRLPAAQCRLRGFTLLELLVSVSITGIAFVVLLTGFGANMKNIGLAEDYTTAALLARKGLVEMGCETVTPGRTEGDFGGDFDRFKWVRTVTRDSEHPYFRIVYVVEFDRSSTSRQVEVTTVCAEAENRNEGK